MKTTREASTLQEKKIAKALGGRRTPNSGATKFYKGDVVISSEWLIEAKTAISKFIHGIAFNAYNFAKQPEKICISGGFCENKCFIQSLEQYCKVIPLGRFVLTEGLSLIE